VLADTAIRGHDLDEAKANEAKQRAEESCATRMRRLTGAARTELAASAVAQLLPSASCAESKRTLVEEGDCGRLFFGDSGDYVLAVWNDGTPAA
jgi:hypothetical protein